jgi:2,3-bisphosphoglycerate-independent phosphoglycerate mutase
MKHIIVVPDGMADHPIKDLGGKTPAEAAETPNLDFLARHGVCGMTKTFFEGYPYDSSIANTAILGYDPRRYFSGRSPLEAANLGIELGEGDISLRCNLVTIKDGRMHDFTAGHITTQESRDIFNSFKKELNREGIEFYPGVSYRNILVLRKNLNPSLSFDATQPQDIFGEEIKGYGLYCVDESAKDTVSLLESLKERANTILSSHIVNIERIDRGLKPANSVWFWGAGKKPDIPSFESLYGVRGSLVSAVDLLNGLAKTVGLEVLKVPGITGYIDTNYEGKADAAIKSLEQKDLTYIHIEATDEAGHEGNLKHKMKAIEDIDKRVIGRIIDNMVGEYRIMILPDHPTPVEVRGHTNEPVPYIIYDSREKKEGASSYSEKKIMEKQNGEPIEAFKLMNILLQK